MTLRKNLFLIFIAHFLLVLLIQVENAVLFYKVPWWKLLTAQFQNIFFSSLLSLLYYFSRSSKGKLISFFIFFAAINILVAMNQIFFQIFHENFAFTFADGLKSSDIMNYWGSFTGELKPFHLINLFYLMATSLFLSRQNWLNEDKFQLGSEKVALPIALVLTAIIQFGTAHSEVNSHLAFTIFRGIKVTPVDKISIKKVPQSTYYKLKYGSPNKEKNQESLSKNKEILKSKKNVIFLVLESVGSMQILNNGKIDKENFPFLGSHSDHIFVFPTLHNNFPGTTRSHIPIITGGQTITWGSVFKELLYPYTGPTLASEFKKLGKKTALISAMGLDFENLASFYNNLGFDYVYDSDRETKEFKKANQIHTWGVDEKVALQRFEEWLQQNGEKPFFVQFLTNTTHHPYGAPSDFSHGLKEDDSYSKYKMSLRYTDEVLKQLVQKLKKMGIAKDTVIYIAGDHGEAFGRFHQNNFAHKSSVYEETIKNFLLVFSPENDLKGGYSSKRGALGDILPTIVSPYTGQTPKGVIGQDLYSPQYQEKIAYFHKNTHPEVWGLRDGQWKYFSEKVGGGNAHLYNLNEDPTEQKNLINSHKDKEAIYKQYVANWFVQTNDNFVKKLKGYEYLGNAGLALEDVNTYGPKRISIGVKPKGLNFTPLKLVHPEESLTIWTHGVSYPKDTKLRYEFVSPSGDRSGFHFTHKSDWSTVYVYHRPNKPREIGTWLVNVYDPNGKKVISTNYKVSNAAKLNWSSISKYPGIRKLAFGIKKNNQDFQELEVINPNERMAVYSVGIPFKESRQFDYEWISPSGKTRNFKFKIKSGWHSVWVYHDQIGPMEEGEWTLNIKRNMTTVISGKFKVDSGAPLHIPIKF